MPLKYHLVSRRDLRKDAATGARLFYGQIRATNRISFDTLCAQVSRASTASKGDVQLVISSMLECMKDHLAQGDIVQMGELGNFRLTAGSKGAETEKEFTANLFKKGRVVFSPGALLRTASKEVCFEKLLPLKTENDEGTEGGEDEGSL